MSNWNVYSITCVDPVYVTQTTIAVTILHKIHYSIEVPKTNKTDYWFSKYNRKLHYRKLRHWNQVTGCYVIFPALFSYYSSSTFSAFSIFVPYFSSIFSISFHYSTHFSSAFSRSFHYSTYFSSIFFNLLFFQNFHIFSLFNLLFFHIFHIISLFNLLFFHIFHIFSLFNLLYFHIFHIISLFNLLFIHISHIKMYYYSKKKAWGENDVTSGHVRK